MTWESRNFNKGLNTRRIKPPTNFGVYFEFTLSQETG